MDPVDGVCEDTPVMSFDSSFRSDLFKGPVIFITGGGTGIEQ